MKLWRVSDRARENARPPPSPQGSSLVPTAGCEAGVLWRGVIRGVHLQSDGARGRWGHVVEMMGHHSADQCGNQPMVIHFWGWQWFCTSAPWLSAKGRFHRGENGQRWRLTMANDIVHICLLIDVDGFQWMYAHNEIIMANNLSITLKKWLTMVRPGSGWLTTFMVRGIINDRHQQSHTQ